MSFGNFFNRLFKQADYKHFDKKLFKRSRFLHFPKIEQLKYLWRFVTAREKKVMIAATTTIAVVGLAWLGIFLYNHISTVPKNGGDYIEAMVGQPKYINPVFSSTNDVDADLAALVYSGLFNYKNNKLTTDLAASYDVSADGKTYTIKLREDVKWSDGEKFTADDVIFTFEAIQNPEVGSPLIAAFQGATIEKMDDYTIIFTLKEPFASFLSSLTVGIIPVHIWGEIQPIAIRLAKNNIQPIGTGPFVFNKLIKDDAGNIQSFVLTKNTSYYQKTPYLQTLTFKFYSDYTSAVEAVRSQNADALSFVPKNLKDKLNGKNFNNFKLILPQYTALFFNSNRQPLLKDANLRLALTQGINKSQLITTALGSDGGTVIDSPFLSGQIGYYPEIKKISYDANAANQLLDKTWTRIQPEEYFEIKKTALLKTRQNEIDALKNSSSSTTEIISSTIEKINTEINTSVRASMNSIQSFYRKDKNDNILSLTIVTSDASEYFKTAQAVAGYWYALGIQTNIETTPARQITKDVMKERSYDVLLYGEIVGADPDVYPFWHSSQANYPGLNLAQFSDRNADKILETARATNNTKEREKLYREFQDILISQLPAIFLYSPNYTLAVNKKIKKIQVDNIFSPAERYADIDNWYIKTTWGWK